MNKKEIESRLLDLANASHGVGPFAPEPGSDQVKLAQRMINEITKLETEIQGKESSKIEYKIAIALRNYTSWFIRGDERKPFLERVIAHLNNAVMGGVVEAKIELTHILIDQKLVRNLDLALKLAGELEQENHLPEWMSSFIEKAKRWAGKVEIPRNCDFSELNATPAVLIEERTKLRGLLNSLIKSNEMDSAAVIAKRLYNLGLLAAYLYGDFDGSSGVSGLIYDVAEEKFKEVKSQFNFDYMARISGAAFLTSTDYKRIENVLGHTAQTISVGEIQKFRW